MRRKSLIVTGFVSLEAQLLTTILGTYFSMCTANMLENTVPDYCKVNLLSIIIAFLALVFINKFILDIIDDLIK